MDRIIFHCDLNGFYASVELLSHPDLRDVPMAVCGDPHSRHGIILAKNEPAKKFGIQTAETIGRRKRSARIWFCCRPTTDCITNTRNWSMPSTTSTPTWWSPLALTRAGWM